MLWLRGSGILAGVTRLQSMLLVVGLLGAGTTAALLRGTMSKAAAAASSAPTPPVGTSASEIALIAEAQRALAAGDPVQARRALREHAERFPDGRMNVQRKLLEAYAERSEKKKTP